MKTLIIVSHPNISKSVINKRWIEELQKHPDKYTVHELAKKYPDEKIDVKKEQQLVEEHGNIYLPISHQLVFKPADYEEMD